MFCYQCEQTARGTGCQVIGVCGKDPEVAALQDVVVHLCKGISQVAHPLRGKGQPDRDADVYILKGLFTTVTNVNFDTQAIHRTIVEGAAIKQRLQQAYASAVGGDLPAGPAAFEPASGWKELLEQAAAVGVDRNLKTFGADVAGLQDLILYGLKGMAAYADHALVLGREDDAVYAFFHEALAYLAGEPAEVDSLVAMALKVGECSLKVMALLDAANTGVYGHPEPTQVRTTPVAGKCILVSGHDLKDLDLLLQQTEGKEISIYTHGEMLPCNAYPGLKKYKHLVGNYGGAWQNQQKEFEQFPGAILMTTNCLQKPREKYKARIFSTGLVGWPGMVHIADKDFSPVIQAALDAPGFAADEPARFVTIGFAHNTVVSVADQVVGAVKSGAIRHFFVIGGCDGAKPGRNYFTEVARQVPQDCVILTAGCGKFRFNDLEFGHIDGIPRLLDCGQCNDSFSAIQIALALAKAFDCGVNDLPLSLIVSWYEQKAVCVLLALLHLGVRKIRLGPTLPAFVGPNVLQALVDNFELTPIGTPEQDLQTILKIGA